LEYLINLLPEIEVVVQPPAVVKKVGVKGEDRKS
jgi:hypothetical protein